MSKTESFEVKGMSCGHCVSAVKQEVSALDGVTGVQIELHPSGTSRVVVSSDIGLHDDAMRGAVDEAGYELVGRT